MTELVVFDDPLLVALGVLRTNPLLAAVDGIGFGTKTPDDLGADYPGAPWVSVVNLYTDPSGYPFTERATLRVSVWGGQEVDEAQAFRLCQAVRAVLASADGPHGSITPQAGPFTSEDPDTETPFAYFDAVIRLRPATL